MSECPEEHLRKVHSMMCYHGLCSRENVEPLLKEKGDFLLRMVKSHKYEVILSVCVSVDKDGAHCSHWPIAFNKNGKGWELVQHLGSSSVKKSNKSRISHRSLEPAASHGPSRKQSNFSTVEKLIMYYRRRDVTEGVRLRNQVRRPRWLIPTTSLKFDPDKDFLGQGNFCKVVRGRWKGRPDRVVAIKMLLESANNEETGIVLSDFEKDDARDNLFKEAQTMSICVHRNVVSFYGVACDIPPVMIVMEYCPGGSLLRHLEQQKSAISDAERILFCVETARGMRYLHHQHITHRDLAVRNCLISSNGAIKISDFGLSRGPMALDAAEEVMKNVPLRWMAPETLSRTPKFSIKSDVWSYGMLVYEVFNHGGKPWPDEDNRKISHYIRHGRMPELTPDQAPPLMVNLMKMCWHKEPGDRPAFPEVVSFLAALQASDPKFRWPSNAQRTILKLPGVVPDANTGQQDLLACKSLTVTNADSIYPHKATSDETVSKDSKDSRDSLEDTHAAANRSKPAKKRIVKMSAE